jgi:hypothetical protein
VLRLAVVLAPLIAPAAAHAKDGSVVAFADDHVHITANLRAGGRVIHGEPFDRSGDVVGNLLFHSAEGYLRMWERTR